MASPWLPQPADWGTYAVAVQQSDPSSMLTLYRTILTLRRSEGAMLTDSFSWLDDDRHHDVIAFQRGDDLACVINFGSTPIDLPPHSAVLLTSEQLDDDGRLPGDTAAWLRTSPTN